MYLLKYLMSKYDLNDYREMTNNGGRGTHKEYTNKNANIEYYTDEKGNIRKRKKHG